MRSLFLKGLWGRRKSYLMVIICGMFQVSITFTISALVDYLSLMADGRLSDFLDVTILSETFFLTYGLLFFLMILVFLSYIRRRAGDYAVLNSLGIKKKHRYMFVACEYGGVFVLSLGGGIVFGILLSGLLKYGLLKIFSDMTVNLYYGTSPWQMVIIVQVVTYIMIFIFFDETIAGLGIEALLTLGRRGGRNYKRHFLLLCAGPALIIVSFVNMGLYWGKGAEAVPSTAALAGLFLLMMTMSGNHFDRIRRQGKPYYKKIIWLDNWYQQFFYNINTSFTIAAFLFVIAFSFFVSLLDHIPVTAPENFPYDLVWMANKEDRGFLEHLEREHGAVIKEQPCFRVATGDFAEQMAISASAYEAWTNRHLDLEGREIYVVYQRDRADRNSLGIDYNTETPDLYIGCAKNDLWIYVQGSIIPGNQFENDYQITGCEDRILTGILSAANQENIIVFSDDYFDEVCRKAEGADLAVMMQIPRDYQTVTEKIYSYAGEHSQKNFFSPEDNSNLIYEKRLLLKAERHSKVLLAAANGMNILILFICALFVFGIKTENDFDQLKQKHELYFQSGIPDKKQKRAIRNEIAVPGIISVFYGLGVSFVFIAEKIYLKNMERFWNVRYVLEILVLFGVIIFIFGLVIVVFAVSHCRRIRRGLKDEP